MGDLDAPLKMSDLPLIVAEIMRAIGDTSRVQFGTVQSVQDSEGRIRLASVQLDGAPAESPNHVPCIYTGPLAAGVRVAVLWDPPHQCYVIGPVSGTPAPYARISMNCPVPQG